MKKVNRTISFILVILILFIAFFPIVQTTVKAVNTVINYYGSVTYGPSEVGKFTVNGRVAFCVDHAKTTPPNGTPASSELYNDSNILKCLYYGWGGDAQWPAFGSEAQGIVCTTLALDYFKNGSTHYVATDFINYVNSMPVPQIILNFSQNSINARLDGNVQKTESISVVGNSNYYLTIQLQNNVTLVNETKNTRQSGIVNIYGGDTFHLEAPLTINGTWTSNVVQNNKYNYQAIIYKTNNDGYQKIASGYEVVPDPSSTTSLNVNWLSTGGFSIHKKDEKNKEAISNTKFEVRNAEGTVVDTITTNDEGYAESRNLIAGEYNLIEVKANDKYILDNKPIKVSISVGENKEIDITNKHKEGSLKIIKVDSRSDKKPISNVTFEIWNVELNEKVATKTTGKDGTILLDNLRTGTYKIREISSNDWYILDTKEKTVEVTWNDITTIEIENEIKKGYIKLFKEDADYSDIKIPNAKFEVRNSKGILVDTIITDEKGYGKSKALPLDDSYFVKEIEANVKYVLSSDIKEVTFSTQDSEKEKTLKFTNKHKQGNIKVIKVDSDNNNIGLGAIQFDLYSEEFQKIIGRYTTDNNGEIYINNLRIGKYKLIEVSTNKWYELASDTQVIVKEDTTNEVIIQNELKKGRIKVIKVDKDNANIKIPNVTFEVLDRNGNILEKITTNENGEAVTKEYPIRDYQTLRLHEIQTNELYELNDSVIQISLEENQTKSIRIENEKKKGQVRVIKVDSKNEEIRLPNVEFEVLDEKGNLVDKIVTDENGEAITKRLPIDQKYTIKETKTLEEYELTEENQVVTLEYNKIIDLKIVNERKRGQIEVYKVDEENNKVKLEGVQFAVINSENEVVEIITTNKDGYAKTSKLPVGEYILKEIKTNEQYVLKDESIKVEVTQGNVIKLNITNERIKGRIKIIKISKDDNLINGEKLGSPIPNVKFEIYDINRNIVDTVITNDEGIAITKELYKGEYFVKEVESGKWYILNEEEFCVKIEENEEIVEVNVTNEPHNPKVDIEKTGEDKAEEDQEIKYEFKIKNTGNVPLSNFTWYDYLPTKYATLTKIYTGTYNENLNYNIYYKTNKKDYKLLLKDLNTQTNNYVDFSNIKLEYGEKITEIKLEFGKVDIGFETIIAPEIWVKVNNVENDDKFTNVTRIEGDDNSYLVWDEDDHTTEIEKKKLPRTGF